MISFKCITFNGALYLTAIICVMSTTNCFKFILCELCTLLCSLIIFIYTKSMIICFILHGKELYYLKIANVNFN
jgi:hypothetical protein